MLRRAFSCAMLTLLLIGALKPTFSATPGRTEYETIIVPEEYPTIQEAINTANHGDVIHVRNGTYHEHLVVNKTVSLIGENKNGTIIDGNNIGTVVTITSDNASVSEFTVQNGEIGLELKSNGNMITSNIFSSNGAQKTDLKTNLEIYPDPPVSPIWRYLYDLINGSYTEIFELTTETPILKVKVSGHSDVAELALGLFYDENSDGVPQLHEFIGFASRDKETWVTLFDPPPGHYIVKVQGWNVMGNPGHFDREVIKYTGYGVGAHLCSNNTIFENLILDDYTGMYFQFCSGMAIHMNNVTRTMGGIVGGGLVDSTLYANKVFSNNFSDVSAFGVSLRASRNINLTKNMLTFNSFGIVLWNSSHVDVIENELYSQKGCSIMVHASCDNNIANNNCSMANVLDGIRLMFSSRNYLEGNDISYCEHSGILLWYDCYNNSAISNRIRSSGSQGWGHGHGVEVLLSSDNVFANNEISFARNQGIVVIESSNNNFTENLISSNARGVIMRSSVGNRIYHNGIIDNLVQQALDDTGANFWDEGYPLGGNYWNDLTKMDDYRGPYQNEPNGDGICDVPYNFDGNQDSYPLMKAYAGPHDIGLRVSVSKTVVAENYNTTITINVTVINYGVEPETFNFSFQLSSTIYEQALPLTNRNSATFDFAWNTTCITIGKYAITIYTEPVQGEVDIVDNNFFDWIVVTILGDVNGDFKCEGKDNALVAKAYDTWSGHSRWIPNADINGDLRVEGKDVAIVAKYYDTHYP